MKLEIRLDGNIDSLEDFRKTTMVGTLTFLADIAGDPPSSGTFEEDLR